MGALMLDNKDLMEEYVPSRAFDIRKTWAEIALVPLVYCVTLGKFFYLSEPLIPSLGKKWKLCFLLHEALVRVKRYTI